MATAIKGRPGRGNRRKGSARGRPGRAGSLDWRRDNEILRRVDMVAELIRQPEATIHQVVNLALEREGRDPVSIQTIRLDKKRARTRLLESIPAKMLDHVLDIEEVKTSAWKDVNRNPAGSPARAPFYAAILTGTKMQAQLDGSWSGAQAIPGQEVDQSTFGPSPRELLEEGRITPDQYRAWLAVFHQHAGGHTEGPASGEVIEGAALPAPASPRPAIRAPKMNGHGEDRDLSDLSAELPRVVDWEPGE